MAVYQAGVTIYLVGRNIVNSVWARQQNSAARHAFNPQDGQPLAFYTERPVGLPSLEAFVEYEAASRWPVPPETVAKVTEIALGYMEQFSQAVKAPLVIAPGIAH